MFRHENPPALILLTESAGSSMWDLEVSQLLDSLEEALDGAFVTHAVASGRGPSVQDALAAARFFGCQRAVVVDTDRSSTRDPDVPCDVTFARSTRTVGGVLSAYLASRVLEAVEGAAA